MRRGHLVACALLAFSVACTQEPVPPPPKPDAEIVKPLGGVEPMPLERVERQADQATEQMEKKAEAIEQQTKSEENQ